MHLAATTSPPDPPHAPDYLAGAVLQSLSRAPAERVAWGPLRSAILGAVTMGLAPLLILPRRFGQYAALESQQMWHLAEWLRLQTGRPEAEALRDQAYRLRASPLLTTVGPIAFVIVAIGAIAAFYADAVPGGRSPFQLAYNRSEQYRMLAMVFTAALAAGYLLCHLAGVNEYIARMRRFVEAFNRLAAAERLTPVQAPRWQLGASGAAIVLGVLLAVVGAWWGLPMMLAAAAQHGYVNNSTYQLRRDMAQRVRDYMRRTRPHMAVAMPIFVRHPCVHERCSASIPAGARFCPRCGTPAAGQLDRVA
jgi:hypothetical protein